MIGIRIWAKSYTRKLSRMIYKNISNLKGKKASFQNNPFSMDKNFTSLISIFKSNILLSSRRIAVIGKRKRYVCIAKNSTQILHMLNKSANTNT